MTSSYVELQGSHRDPPQDATAIASAHAANPSEQVEVSIYLKDRDPDPIEQPAVTAEQYSAAAKSAGTAEDVRTQRMDEYKSDIDAVSRFASDTGLSVVKADPSRRLVKVSGTIAALEAAFRTKLHYYNNGAVSFRARAGSLSVPTDVADKIEAVLGLDTRPLAKPKLTLDPHVVTGHLPNEVAKLYDFPVTNGKGAGQCIALIELGGGFIKSDNKKAFKAMGLQPPSIVSISVSGGSNRPGADSGADGEVALDIQVAGGAAPGATIAVYFAPNTVQGFVDAITRACHDPVNRPSVISISWGSSESNWTGQGIAAMTTALKDAARLNITVLAAAGDNLSTDGVSDNLAHTDFPASSPYVLGCGGTVINTVQNSIQSEIVWNNGNSGTGGGISDLFPLPAYQASANIPVSVNNGHVGRGVPDVAANADPNSGYRTVVGGRGSPIGGTSAVAPLWAGLFALINEDCGKSVGFVHPLLYGNPAVFRQITVGNNNAGPLGYPAGPGWNACTGLGVPQGRQILQMFQTALKSNVAAMVA